MNVLAIVPATLSRDGRETGQLAPVLGKPPLGHLLDRLAHAEKLASIVVTTSDEAQDAPIVDYCAERGTPCLTGARDDLIGRLLAALESFGAKGGVMVDAACPLIDPALVDQVAELLQMTDGMLDWIGNTLAPAYPRGMEIDGFTKAALTEAETRCGEAEQRRQGPAFLRLNSRIYRPLSLKAPPDLARPEVELQLSGPERLPRLESILRHFEGRTDFRLAEILSFVDSRLSA
jgi:spore coat polysaccharide biosynthesis protein SpsF